MHLVRVFRVLRTFRIRVQDLGLLCGTIVFVADQADAPLVKKVLQRL